MPGCATKCTNYRTNTIDNAWTDIHAHFGPGVAVGSPLYTTEINLWNLYAAEKGHDPVADVEIFGKWLVWKCAYGTTNMGNLPTRKRDHVGISCIPCPYDTGSDLDRSEVWLGQPVGPQNDHGEYYMRVAQRGNRWGFECTFSGCPYLIDNGRPYFHA